MKVEGPGKSQKTSKSSKAKKTSGASGAEFAKLIEDAAGTAETGAAAAAAGVSQVQRVDALLTIQEGESGDTPQSRRRAMLRAESILNQLDRLRVGILTGEITRQTLTELSRLAASHRDRIMDPRLAEILDEIDLRAQIELAKLSRNS